MNYQQIADKIIKINRFHFDLIEQKSQVNYLNSLKNSTRTKRAKNIYNDIGVGYENFKFESFDGDYLNNIINKLRAEEEDVKKVLETYSDVDSDDYK